MSLAPQLIVAISKFDGVGEKNIVAGAEVIITRRAGGAQNIYSDETGTSLITQPTYTDENGELKFFIADGAYTYTIAGQSYSVDVNGSQTATFSTVTADQFIGDQFLGREIILEDIDFGRVLVRDIADHTHYAEFKYEAPGNRATLSRTGYIHFDMSPTYVAVYDQVGAPILKGETSRTRLYRGGAEVFNVDADLLKIGFSASNDILLADISDSAVRIKNPNGTYPLYSAGGTLSLERPDGVDVLVSNSTVTNIASYNGGNLLTSTSSITALYAPDGSAAFDASTTATVMRYANGNPFATASNGALLQYENGNSMVIANASALAILNPNNTQILSANSTATTLSSPAAQPVISATTTTTTINAGNGAPAIAISSSGGVVAQDYLGQKYSREHQWSWTHDGTLYRAVDIIIDSPFGWGELEINVTGNYSSTNNTGQIKKIQQVAFSGATDYRSGALVSEYSSSGTVASLYHVSDLYYSASRSAWVVTITSLYSNLTNEIVIRAKLTLQASQTNQSLRGLTLSSTYTGTSKTAYATGLTVPSLQADSATISGSSTAGNFYGNGFGLTALNASEVKNGLLPSNIFPATISAATITFDNTLRAKGGTAYNLLDITSAASILRDSAGNDVFNASTTALALKRANNIVLNASSTATQLFNHAGNIRANFDASISQIFSPASAPVISATTTTATISSGNGATCLTIDSTGAGLMRFPVYTVSTVPSASANADRVIIVSNASLGRGLYTSDGTNWRSAQSGTILS